MLVDGIPHRLRVQRARHQDRLAAGQEPRERRPLRRRVHQRGQRQVAEGLDHPVGQLVRRVDRADQAHRITAADAGEERILLAPHHALRPTGGPSRVHEVGVVARPPGGLHRSRRRGRQHRLVAAGLGQGHDLAAHRGRIRIGHDQERADALDATRHRRHGTGEGLVHQQRHRTGILQQVAQLGTGVAVVHVHRDRPQRERRQHRLQVGGVVPQEQPDPVAGADTRLAQVVGEAVGPLGQFGVGPGLRAAHQGDPLRAPGPDRLPQVREVVCVRNSPLAHI